MKMYAFPSIALFILIVGIRAVSVNVTHCKAEEAIFSDIMSGYNRHVRPCSNVHDPIKISVIFSLMNINELDELTGKFSVIGFFYISWSDPDSAGILTTMIKSVTFCSPRTWSGDQRSC